MEDSLTMNTPNAISGLSKRPQSMQSSIVSRTTTRFYTSGSSSFNKKYNDTLNFKLSSSDYIDASTATLNFRLKTNAVYQIPETLFGLAMIEKAVLKINNQEVEQIDDCSGLLRSLFYLNNDKNVVTGPIGTAAGEYKYRTRSGMFLKNNSTGVTDDTNSIKPCINLGGTTYKNFGTAAQLPPGAKDYAVPGNCLELLTCGGSLSLPEGALWSRQALTAESNNRLISGQENEGRDYSVRLMDIFEFFKSETYVPLRNLGSIDIQLTLSSYDKCFINVPTYSISNAGITNNLSTISDADVLAVCTNETYDVIAPYISIDCVQPNLLLVNALDAQASGSEGFAMVYSSWSTQVLSQPYGTSLQFTTNKSFSHCRDLLCVLRPQNSQNGSKFLRYDQTYYGSRCLENKTIIGSANFPLTSTSSSSSRLMEVQKAFAMHNSNTSGTVIDLNVYTGANPHLAGSSRGFYPSLTLNNVTGVSADNKACIAQAGALWAEPNSEFSICQSFEKFISSSRFLSGINTKLTTSQITLDLKMREWKDTDPNTDFKAATSLNTVDAILGNSPVSALLAVHWEGLLLVSNNSVTVQR